MPLWNDLRFASRQVRKSPVFTITVLTTLGLCIGANAAIYSLVDTLFFKALPYPDPGRLVVATTVQTRNGASRIQEGMNGREWEAIRDHTAFLESAVSGGVDGANLFAGGHVEYVQQERVSANFFHVFGIAPFIGREFSRQEDVRGGPALTVLSYGLWQRLFRGDPAIVGRTIDLRGAPFTVIGIMPRGFRSDVPVDLWTPLQPSTSGEGGGTNYEVIARLKPGVTFAQASGQLSAVLQPIYEDMHPPSDLSISAVALPLQTAATVDMRSRVEIMWGAVGLVLLIGCVNIAGILLARSGTRRREIATRMAVGGNRSRIVGQLLWEAVLLALGGGILGLLIGKIALKGLAALNPEQFNFWGPVHLDVRVSVIILVAALGTSILFGLFPAFEATSVDLRSALSEAGRGSSGSLRQWKRQALVFAEVALGVVLVISAGLLIRTFSTLMNRAPGFNPDRVMTAELSLQDARYKTTASGVRLFRETLDRIRQIPGVESAAVALRLPYERDLNVGIEDISGRDISHRDQITNFTYVTAGFFETLQIPLLRGRVFTETDDAQAPKVVIVNQAFLRHYMPDVAQPLGTRLKFTEVNYQIAGVIGNVQEKRPGWGDDFAPIVSVPHVYVPVAQFPEVLFPLVHQWFSPSWVVRTHGSMAGLPQAMRRALQAVDPRLPFSTFKSMSEVRGASLQDQRYQATLFSALAALALILAALGVYGLVAQSVLQRTREMGIRLALGATISNVMRAAAGPGIVLSLIGIATGFALALFATRLLKSMIWGVSATDPVTFLGVAALLISVAVLASLVPALRLTRLDPAQTLREQ
ncbi:MAG: ABC transporter permease [Acidobacteriaceae bacterium]|nr:ABC transporter permease [Acidobacteriaceae bacterium]